LTICGESQLSDIQTLQQSLTVVLPLKGRNSYTKFWLDYALSVSLPFRIIIADGNKDNEIESYLIENAQKYAGLDIDYTKYPYDETYDFFYKKMLKSLQKVKTPYVMMLDNDTFPVISNLIQNLEFMLENRDYSCSRGWHIDYDYSLIDESKRSVGLIADVDYIDLEEDYDIFKSFEDQDGLNRLRDWCGHINILFYNIHKTENIVDIWKVVCQASFIDLTQVDLLLGAYSVLTGKTKVLDGIYLMRHRSSPESASHKMVSRSDIVDRLLNPKWTADLNFISKKLSSLIEKSDDCNNDIVKESISGSLKQYYSDRLYSFLKSKKENIEMNGMCTNQTKGSIRVINAQMLEQSVVDKGIYDMLLKLNNSEHFVK